MFVFGLASALVCLFWCLCCDLFSLPVVIPVVSCLALTSGVLVSSALFVCWFCLVCGVSFAFGFVFFCVCFDVVLVLVFDLV